MKSRLSALFAALVVALAASAGCDISFAGMGGSCADECGGHADCEERCDGKTSSRPPSPPVVPAGPGCATYLRAPEVPADAGEAGADAGEPSWKDEACTQPCTSPSGAPGCTIDTISDREAVALFDVLHAVTFDPTTIDGVWESTNSATPTRVRITRFTLALAIRCHDLAVIPPDAVAGLRAPIEGSASMQQLIVQRDSEASAKGGPACRLQLGQGETLPYELSNGSLTLHSINQSWTFQKVSD